MYRSANLEIGVVILNYATYPETITLVEALQNQTLCDNLRIVIVDNASPNESYIQLKPLQEQFDNVVAVLQIDENLGYAKGNNFGLKYLEENDTPDYVAILNNDVILPNDCFEKLIERYNVLDNPALIAPVMVNPDGQRIVPNKINSFWLDFSYMFLLLRALRGGSSYKDIEEIDNTGLKAMQVEVITGSFMFVKFDVFKQMGFFYPDTFLYAEERFVAYEAKRLGYKNYLLLDQSYIHNHSTTISAYHKLVSKNRMLYDGYLKFTKKYRKHGALKGVIMQLAIWWSLGEWWIIEKIKNR